jgi:hypothetical protein
MGSSTEENEDREDSVGIELNKTAAAAGRVLPAGGETISRHTVKRDG